MLFTFSHFQLDVRGELLLKDGRPIHLRPKSYAVLQALVERAGDVVSREELLAEVWGDRSVSEDVVRISVHEARKALDDHDRKLIQTVPRRGFRLLAEVERQERASPVAELEDEPSSPASVGYGEVRKAIAQGWQRVTSRRRSELILLEGEAGIGKSTLMHDGLAALPSEIVTLYLECRELDSQSGFFQPLQAALESARDSEDAEEADLVRRALEERGRGWRVLIDGDTPAAGQAPSNLASLAREFESILAFVCRSRPVAVVIDDLQWADVSCLSILKALSRTQVDLPILVLATLRQPIAPTTPLSVWREGITGSERIRSHRLRGFEKPEVALWLKQKLCREPTALEVDSLFDLSGGRPLFLEIVVDHLLARGALAEGNNGELIETSESAFLSIPGARHSRLHSIVTNRLTSIPEFDRDVLQAAAVVGETHPSFDATLLSSILEIDEDLCDAALSRLEEWECFLSRSTDPRQAREQPAAGVTQKTPRGDGHYRFRHAFYRDVVGDSLSRSRKRALHRATAETLETAGRRVARERAHHWCEARDRDRELVARKDAAQEAAERYRHVEVLEQSRRGIEILDAQADPPFEVEFELRRQHLGSSLMTEGVSASQTLADTQRLVALAESHGNNLLLSILLPVLGQCHSARGEYALALRASERSRQLGTETKNGYLIAESYGIEGHVALQTARLGHAVKCGHEALLGPEIVTIPGPPGEIRPHLGPQALLSFAKAISGRIAESREHLTYLEGMIGGRALDPGPGSVASTLVAYHHAWIGDDEAMVRAARDGLANCEELGILDSVVVMKFMASVGSSTESLEPMKKSFARLYDFGARTHMSIHMATVARNALLAGVPQLALDMARLGDALTEETGEVIMRPELRRLEAEALFALGNADRAKSLLRESLDEATQTGANLLVLRTATSVVKLAGAGLTGVLESPDERLEQALVNVSDAACPAVEEARPLLIAV